MSSSEPVSDDAPLQIGEWRVDPRADEIFADGRVVKLEPLRMRLLMALARRPGEVVLSNELLDTVWKGSIVTPSSLYQSVAHLRQLLGDSADEPRYIATVPRKGYRLVARVSPLPAPSGAIEAAPAAPELAVATPVPAPGAQPAVAAALPSLQVARRGLIAGGVAAAAALAAGGVWWQNRPPSGPVRIAVLPFSDRSTAQLDQPLANGFTDDVIRALGRHPSIEVMAFDAVARLTRNADLLAEAKKRLEVAFALIGEIRRAGERIQISTKVITLPDEGVRSEALFDETLARLAVVPQAIAVKAIDALRLKPLALAHQAAPSSGYEMYVLGTDALRAKTPESVERARRYFSQGIDIDPLYARNYSGLGWSWIVQQEVGGARLDWREAYARAEPLFAKALQLDQEQVEARLGLANVARQYQRYDEARRTYDAVIQQHPNNIQARFGLAVTEESDGWPTRAIAQYERAAALDPTHFLIPVRAGLALMYAGRLAEAEARFKRSIDLDGSRPNGYYSLGILHWQRGRLDASVAAYREALKRSDQLSYVWADYAFVCIDLGLYAEAQRAFERTAGLLRTPNFAATEAAFSWVAQGAAPPVPNVLMDTTSSPAPRERLLILAMAGERPSLAALNATEAEQSGQTTPTTALYDIVSGRFRTLDFASLFTAAGASERAAPLLEYVERTLTNYEQRGVTAPAFSFHRARLLALRGDTARALSSLQAAVDKGWRRAWWIRRDPAFERIRSESAFTALLQKLDTQLAELRKSVGS